MFNRVGLFFILLLSGASIKAQVIDTIANSFKHRPHLEFGLSTRYTFIDGFQKPVFGIREGFNFNNRMKIGVGFCFLKNPYYVLKFIDDPNGQQQVFSSEIRFWYVMNYVQYVFHKTKKWEFSLPLQFGVGACKVNYFDDGIWIPEKRRTLLIYEPVIAGHYKIVDWFAVGADVGFRFMWVENSEPLNLHFNSPVYAFKTIIFWKALYKRLAKDKK